MIGRVRVFHIRRDREGLVCHREVYAPWASNRPEARVAWAVHQAFEEGGAVEVVNV